MCEGDFVFVHQLCAAFIDHAGQVGHVDVFTCNTEFEQQIKAGQRRSARTRCHQLDLPRRFADHFERVQNRRAHSNRRAVLVIMKDWNLHALAQLALDVKTVWRFDVFQINGTKSGLQRGNDVDQFGGVFFVNFDVKNINASKLFKQHRLAFHHRLGGQRANVTQPQHGRAVGDHRHQVAACGVLEGVVRVFNDLFTGSRHAGRVS